MKLTTFSLVVDQSANGKSLEILPQCFRSGKGSGEGSREHVRWSIKLVLGSIPRWVRWVLPRLVPDGGAERLRLDSVKYFILLLDSMCCCCDKKVESEDVWVERL